MNNQDIIDHFKNKKVYPYHVYIPEKEFLEFTKFKELKCFDISGRDDCTYIYLGTVEDRSFWYLESSGVFYNDFGFFDELENNK